ncbi:MAG: hypothetical protein ACRDSF_13990 [Pseudonocardiaceae bacterium]
MSALFERSAADPVSGCRIQQAQRAKTVPDNPAEPAECVWAAEVDEGAFRDLVKRYHASLVRLARASVTSQAVAEEVAQDDLYLLMVGRR